MKRSTKDGFGLFQTKMMRYFCGSTIASILVVAVLYYLVWKKGMGDVFVFFLSIYLRIDHETAFLIYHKYFRGNKEIIYFVAVIIVLFLLVWLLFRWMNQYFKEINQGINALLKEDDCSIRLSKEMMPLEMKLNTVKQTLRKRKQETQQAKQKKDDLIIYLAHDIRTPLTSVIGYLNLLEENLDMPIDQRKKHLKIVLEKSYRLEQMVNEFFEIIKYSSQQIQLKKASLDLGLMLVQLADEHSLLMQEREITIAMALPENLIILADADKLARVFGNILKNAAAYAYPKSEIKIYAEKQQDKIIVSVQNKGKEIPQKKLTMMFDKFYRLDDARISDTGGSGLGLAIAKVIVQLHGGQISATSKKETVTIVVELPIDH